MSLILNLSVLLASQFVSDWLYVPELCRLESALGSVLSRLHLMFIYERASMVCSAWDTEGYFESELEWMIARKIKVSSLCLEEAVPSSVAMKITALLFQSKLHLKHLSFYDNKHVFEIITPCIAMCCGGIRHLELTKCNMNIRPLLAALNSVSELCFRDCSLFSADFYGIAYPSVKKLLISGNIPDSAQLAVWTVCPNLTDYTRFNGTVYVSKQTRPLQKVTLYNSPVQTKVEFAATLVSATTISVRFARWGTFWFPTVIEASANYFYMDVSSNDSLDKMCFQAIGASPSCKYLKLLSVARCPGLITSTLRYICTKCSALTSLDISGNRLLRRDVCEMVLRCLPQLHTLKANRTFISDCACDAIASSKLTVLEMEDTYGYTDNGVIALMNGCNNLEKLFINDGLVNSLVRKLWREKATALQVLYRDYDYDCDYENGYSYGYDNEYE